MSVETQVAPARTERDKGMVHVAASCCPPYVKSLCGVPFRDRGPDFDAEENCVVCAEMARIIRYCPQCGAACS